MGKIAAQGRGDDHHRFKIKIIKSLFQFSSIAIIDKEQQLIVFKHKIQINIVGHYLYHKYWNLYSTLHYVFNSLFYLSRYILTSDLGLRMECCFLSGYFFKVIRAQSQFNTDI